MSSTIKTLSIKFWCRASKRGKDGKSPVEMVINLDGERLVTHLPRREKPDSFQQQMNSRRTNPLREFLNAVESRIREHETHCLREGVPLTIESINDFIEDGFTERSGTIGALTDDFFKSLKLKRDSGAMTPKRYRKYEIALNHFLEGTGLSLDERVTKVKNKTIKDFQHYLIGEGFEPGTIAGFLQCLKSIVLFGLQNGQIKENPFTGIKIGRKANKVRFLSEDEVSQIKRKRMPTEGLEHVKDIFLFQCYTALSYCDMALLEPGDFQTSGSGFVFIEKPRKKTGVPFLVVLLPEALAIARKYDYHLPVISNQRYNVNLKEIAMLCGIEKTLHSHVGRHTAATFLLNKGVPMEIVAKVLGHSTTAQTRHYAKLLDDSVFREFKKLEETLK